jgi:hypothetical protein
MRLLLTGGSFGEQMDRLEFDGIYSSYCLLLLTAFRFRITLHLLILMKLMFTWMFLMDSSISSL